MSTKISVLLVDDHKIIRDAIKFYFEEEDVVEITDEAEDGNEAINLLKRKDYDIVISDINMPEMDGIEFMKNVSIDFPEQRVLILSMHGDAGPINKMISLGARGYVLKTATKDELIKAISEVSRGGTYFSREVYDAIIRKLAKREPKQRLTLETELSEREKEVLKLITEELSNPEIAEKLFISIRTVETHKRNLLEKTGCKNVAGLVMYAVEHSMVQ